MTGVTDIVSWGQTLWECICIVCRSWIHCRWPWVWHASTERHVCLPGSAFSDSAYWCTSAHSTYSLISVPPPIRHVLSGSADVSHGTCSTQNIQAHVDEDAESSDSDEWAILYPMLCDSVLVYLYSYFVFLYLFAYFCCYVCTLAPYCISTFSMELQCSFFPYIKLTTFRMVTSITSVFEFIGTLCDSQTLISETLILVDMTKPIPL